VLPLERPIEVFSFGKQWLFIVRMIINRQTHCGKIAVFFFVLNVRVTNLD
jgi:hypothetical protein